MRSPVTAVIQAFNALSDDEKKLCLDFIAPEPEPEPEAPARKPRKKRGPSTRAQSLSTAITSSTEAKRGASNNGGPDDLFVDDGTKCGTCGNLRSFQDHFPPSPNFHEFEEPKAKKAAQK